MATSAFSARSADNLAGPREAFAAACEKIPPHVHERFLALCGRTVRLRIAGDELATQLTRCFEPFLTTPTRSEQAKDAAIDLKVYAWDRVQSGVGCPGIALVPDTTDQLGAGLLSQFLDGRLLRYDRASMIKCFDRCTNEMFICVQDAGRTGLADRGKPFPHFLATWCHDRGVEVLHAGLVSRDGRGVLLAGGSGSGKSTCAVASALAGFDFLGDDCIGTELTPSGCLGHALYNAVRVDDGNLKRLPRLEGFSHDPRSPRDRNKSLVYMSDLVPGKTVATTSIAAIAVPRIAGHGASRLVAITKGSAVRMLAPSTLLRGLGTGVTGLAHIAELVRRLPCYALEVGATVDDVPRRLDELLDSIEA